jgi:hypothetical protein
MGVLAPGSAHTRPSAQPPPTLLEIFRCTCLQSNLQNFRKNLKIAPRGPGGGGPNYFFYKNFYCQNPNSTISSIQLEFEVRLHSCTIIHPTTNSLLLLLTAPDSQVGRLYNSTVAANQAGRLYNCSVTHRPVQPLCTTSRRSTSFFT